MAARRTKLKLDEVGYWSEIKLDIIRRYAKEYSTILAAQKKPKLYHVYIDAFAGTGVYLSRTSWKEVVGSPLIAAQTAPPFREYHFIDLDGHRVAHLGKLFAGRPEIHLYEGDCNEIMHREVLPKVRFEQYRRGLCLLDPYGLHLNWDVIREAGRSGAIDMFLNFPIADMNRNVFWQHPERVADSDIMRMKAFWGDESWRMAAYKTVPTLFEPEDEKQGNRAIADAFANRLRDVAGFRKVAEPGKRVAIPTQFLGHGPTIAFTQSTEISTILTSRSGCPEKCSTSFRRSGCASNSLAFAPRSAAPKACSTSRQTLAQVNRSFSIPRVRSRS